MQYILIAGKRCIHALHLSTCITRSSKVTSLFRRYDIVGTALLDDQRGRIVPSIAATVPLLGQPERIATEVLRAWVRGERCGWHLLVTVLRSSGLQALAEEIEDVLGAMVL